MNPLAAFSPATRTWFEETFDRPTPIQQHGWAEIAAGHHALLIAPTGSGKTLAAFLAGIDYCLTLPPDAAGGVRVLYISPLKALVHDVERNLRAPLVGIAHRASQLGQTLRRVGVDVRTGDTSQRERQRQAKSAADILVTTPESLFLLLGSKARENLRRVHTIIVDEVHALAPNKRGVHLALSLERLSALCAEEPRRIGLSATIRPPQEVARFLGGRRPVKIVDQSMRPQLDLEVTVPVPDMENIASGSAGLRGGSILGELYTRELDSPEPQERGIWPAIYPQLLHEVRENQATLIFVNSRGLCERLTQRLNELAGEELVQSHHGSVSHEKRAEIEEGLKQGHIRGIVATSSLELGIDMGSIDRVLLVESPGSVARGLQRIGRAGHRVGETSIGRIFPKFRGDLLESAVIARRMRDGEIEPIVVPQNALDVLAQQVVAICCDAPVDSKTLLSLVTAAYPYRELSMELLQSLLEMLSGHYPSQDFADLRPLLAWDRASDELRPRRGAAMLSRLNAGTIPDRGNYRVTLGPEGARLGELDEEMVFETRAGENILLGATTWRVEEITRDRVIVSPAPGEPGKLPFWRGDGPGRPIELGRALGGFVRELAAMREGRAREWLMQEAELDANAAENLAAYVREQREHNGTLPTDRSITVERFRDELGDWRVCILSPFGARVHAPWAMALQQRLSSEQGFEVQLMYTDDGIVLRFADVEELPDLSALLPDVDELDGLVTEQLAHTAMFAGLFRENAARALLLPRRRPDRRSPLWAQRLKAQNLLAAVRGYPSFPIVLETYRQALGDIFDLAALKRLLHDIEARKVRIHEVETRSASPFARSLVFAYVAAYIYEQDAPLAERRAQALTLDRNLLAELLGQAELRELIDPEVVEVIERQLQRLPAEFHARDADEIHDLLRRLGDLSETELVERADVPPSGALAQLERERRAVRIRLAGENRWIAADEAGLYRDALGVMPPSGLPDAYLAAPDRPLEQLFARFAGTHGPFLTGELGARLGLPPGQVEPVLRLLSEQGTLVHGEIRPGGVELDWCHVEVMRRLKRGTLARLRSQVAPVDGDTLGRFLPVWQGVGVSREGPQRLLEVVHQLEGLPLPWSAWLHQMLPMRVPGFRVDMLDMLAATGQIVWVGNGALGVRDGRIAIYRRESARVLVAVPDVPDELGVVQSAILECLDTRGASFLFELEDTVRHAQPGLNAEEFRDALWDLVWAGLVSNDTFGPLRALGARSVRARQGRGRSGTQLASGRWTLVSSLTAAEVTETERIVARTHMLLERYGVVSRETVAAEALNGGFAPVYKVLAGLEEGGRVRRGYFVEGMSGAQFAQPAVVDRLRESTEERPVEEQKAVTFLAAVDPASPWGSLLPWPDVGDGKKARPKRVAGAWVLLHAGKPLLYLGRGGRQLLTFPTNLRDKPVREAAFAALQSLPRGTRRRSLVIEKIDGLAAVESPYRDELLASGFIADYRGLASEVVT